MNANCSIFDITCRVDPNPFGVPHPKQQDVHEWKKTRERSFSADPSRAVVLMHVRVHESELCQRPRPLRWGRLHVLNLLVHRDALLQAIHAQFELSMSNNGETGEESIKTVPWTQWAHGIVRWCVDDDEHPFWITSVSGQRFVTLNTCNQLVVKDFNPHAVKRMCTALQTSGKGRELQLSDSTCARIVGRNARLSEDRECLETVFQSDDLLIAELPYVETVSDLLSMGLEYDSVLMDEERIIGLMVRRRTPVLYTRAHESQKLIRCCSYTGRLSDKRRCQLRCHLNVGVGQLGDCIRYITSA